MSQLKIADTVWHRVVQIIQEAMLEGVDCADLLRQVRVVPDSSDPHVLTLSPEYEHQVKEMHDKLLARAEELQAAQKPKLLIGDGNN
jgi:hypothetical protein